MTLTLEHALEIIYSLSEVSKMPCYSYATSALRCQRGSQLHKIPGSVCNKCYARRGNFRRPSIVEHLEGRAKAMLHPQWAEAMAVVLTAYEQSGYFRWFASGDLQSLEDLLKICEVAKRTPHIKHWLSTHEIGILSAFKRAGYVYPSNLVVRLSADMIDKPPSAKLMASLGVLGAAVSKRAWTCEAERHNNMCMACRKCWNPRVPVVTYKYH